MSSKLKSLTKKLVHECKNKEDLALAVELGVKTAFNIIEESLAQELNHLESYPFMGERIMTLKLYKNKIASILEEMEKEYE